ncbi:acyl-CoA synthetase/AMP-acid ligase [Nitzschia inconspicua]|uniref:Acyl-CoA synthetase/AMP-acid ligase n=1 Tax=Nitzschia inconspicua TaxID=303405 RepID=A0A9K3PZE7_9STRA|nr:acyl-CoA synthetase/AMP-acid ligase [Nitzschia inconspicua]
MSKENVAEATKLVALAALGIDASPSDVWASLQTKLSPSIPFEIHQLCYAIVYEGIDDVKPAWIPTADVVANTNITKMMQQKNITTYQEFYDWSVNDRNNFWMTSMKAVGIQWQDEPKAAFKGDPAHITYFPGGRLNISDSCFGKRPMEDPAIVYSVESNARSLRNMSFGRLDALSNRIANGLFSKLKLQVGDAVGICMPMTPESIAIYLGVVKAGLVVVSIADSFSPEEIATRCRLSNAKAIFTQDVIYRGAKFLPLFGRVLQADAMIQAEKEKSRNKSDFDDAKETKSDSGLDDNDICMRIIVLPGMLHANSYPEAVVDETNSTWSDKDAQGRDVLLHESVVAMMRENRDASWYDLLDECSDTFESVPRDSMDACNILFSSGTTGEPKAIVWSHSTPIKCAIDGFYHQDIHIGDRVAWPTNIGWMMGPWLLFQLINGATIGLFNGITSTESFCEFVDEAEISMLGVVPSLVKSWQARNATANCDWSRIKKFSSTGEASDPGTYLWLMSRVPGYAPVMEYCGGTEIGGSFLSSTLVQPNVPSMFSTPVLGSKILMMNAESEVILESAFETRSDGSGSGELVIVPPSIGLSTTLLNRDHYNVYFEGMPCGPAGEVLRKHGDEVEFVRSSSHTSEKNVSTPYFRALGRCDDTMNIGGIKVGSVEIERVCNLVDSIQETAAIAVSGPHGGPSKLVVYVVLENGTEEGSEGCDKDSLRNAMQNSIKAHLNPLFGISDVAIVQSLPRTASNKVMRRLLRDAYVSSALKRSKM